MLVYKDGTIAHFSEFFPNTSFAASGPNDSFLSEHGAYKVSVFLAHDRDTEKLVGCEPYVLGEFAYTVKVEAKTQDEIDSELAVKGQKIRAQRDALLLASDWTQLSDAPVDKDKWAAYRQQLRDITEQEDFPLSVDWPNKP